MNRVFSALARLAANLWESWEKAKDGHDESLHIQKCERLPLAIVLVGEVPGLTAMELNQTLEQETMVVLLHKQLRS